MTPAGLQAQAPKVLDLDLLPEAVAHAVGQRRAALGTFGTRFPDDNSIAGNYPLRVWEGLPDGENIGWTTGFWTGSLCLAYELTGDRAFLAVAEGHLPGFGDRLERRTYIDHHDIGFLFTLSAVAIHKLTGSSEAWRTGIHAADCLMERYLPQAGIIQAWGDLNDPLQRGRIIIDCLMNLPLLHWASAASGDRRYAEAARKHLLRSKLLVRDDGSSHHTYHFDPATGDALRGSTHQGLSDHSCWARGQAWGLYGFALNHRFAPDLGLLDLSIELADYFLAHLPSSGVAYWDLCFGDGSDEPLDSSASAIAACGLLELCQQLPAGPQHARYRDAALRILKGLYTHCAAPRGASNAVLLHGVYALPQGLGIDEANLWGDYFYIEALTRLSKDWHTYW